MSNLKLPEMSLKNLLKLAPSDGDWKKIANATWIRRQGDIDPYVEVKHHHTIIASINAKVLMVTNGGFHTLTTAKRLNQIVRDNGVEDRWIGIRQGDMYALGPDRKPVGHLPTSFVIN